MFLVIEIGLLIAVSVHAYNETEQWNAIDDDVRSLTESLPIPYQIGQMLQINLAFFLTKNSQLNRTKLAAVVEEFGVGSILNSPSAANPGVPESTCSEWRQLITDIQSIAQHNGPKIPIIYGLDSVHGANYVQNATLFPQQIGLAATFNRDLVRKSFEITAKDSRACGIPWVFSPILDIATQKAWPRVYETFGEDPYLTSEMGYQAVIGLQGDQKDSLFRSDKVACSLKHFVGYSNPRSGQDRTQAWIPDRVLRQYFLPSFRNAIHAGAATVMETYGDVNGSPVVGSEFYLKTILRDELGFKGMLVTDYDEVNSLYWWHHAAHSPLDAVNIVMNKTTIDMAMSGRSYNFSTSVQDLLSQEAINPGRIALSCARVLQLKKNLGLLTNPFPTNNTEQVLSVGNTEDRQIAVRLAEESITLLKNAMFHHDRHHKTLPISKHARVFLTGPTSNSIALLNSGWTIHWQGGKDREFSSGTSIKQGLLSHLDDPSFLTHFDGSTCDNCSETTISDAVNAAKRSDVIVVCLGEPTYAEKPGNINDMELDSKQIDLVRGLYQTGIPIITVLTMGRPRLLGPIVSMSSAVIHAYFPGSEGGEAIANVIFGSVNPSGRLPITWPKHSALQNDPYWHAFSSADTYLVEFPFGAGFSYTEFSYSNITLSSDVMTANTSLQVSVEISNVGRRDGLETVMLFLNAEYRTIAPEVRMLKRFQKVPIAQKSSRLVQFEIFTSDTEFFVGSESRPVLESGQYTVQIGDKTARFTLDISKDTSTLLSQDIAALSDGTATNDWAWSLIYFFCGLIAGLPIWHLLINRQPNSKSEPTFKYGLLS